MLFGSSRDESDQSFWRYLISRCDIIIYKSAFTAAGSFCENTIGGHCVLYEPDIQQPACFCKNSFSEGLFVGGSNVLGCSGFESAQFTYIKVEDDYDSFLEKTSFQETLEFAFSNSDSKPAAAAACSGYDRTGDQVKVSDNRPTTAKKAVVIRDKKKSMIRDRTPISLLMTYKLIASENPDVDECLKDVDEYSRKNISDIKRKMRDANIIAFCPSDPACFSCDKLEEALSKFKGRSNIVIYFGPNVLFRDKKTAKTGTLFESPSDEKYTIIFDCSKLSNQSIVHNHIRNSRIIVYRPTMNQYSTKSVCVLDNECSQLFVVHKYDHDHAPGRYPIHVPISCRAHYLHFGDGSSFTKLIINPRGLTNSETYRQTSPEPIAFSDFIDYVLEHSGTP